MHDVNVNAAMSDLQNTMVSDVNYYRSSSCKSRLTNCKTEGELEKELDDICDGHERNVTEVIERTRDTLKSNLPTTHHEIKVYNDHILPNIKHTMNLATNFWSRALNEIEKFFISMLRAVMAWIMEEVNKFVGVLGEKVNQIFAWMFN